MNLNVCAKTTVGRRRENQDTYFYEIFDGPRGCLHAVAAVCDGMGGHEGGQTASRLAVEAIETRLGAIPDDPAQIDSWVTETLQSIQTVLTQAAQANPALEDMGTTLVMSLIGEETVWIVNIGDSRAYSISSEKAELLTRDHSSLQEALDQGMYTMEDIQSNEVLRSMSSAITRYVGPQANFPPDIYHFPRWAGGWLLLCSDGLTGNVSDLIISEYELWKYVHGTDRIESAAEALVDLAYQNGSSDNITVVLLEIGDPSRAEVSVISNAETNETEIS
ncbi:hypothetical protein GF373_14070 [bacterium]|nr:hypothetical protein [bacterium]